MKSNTKQRQENDWQLIFEQNISSRWDVGDGDQVTRERDERKRQQWKLNFVFEMLFMNED